MRVSSIPSDLRTLASQLISSFRPAAARHDSILENDIATGIRVHSDPQLLAAVLGKLLSAIILHSKGSYIRITAESKGNDLLLQFRDHHSIKTIAIDNSFRHLAQKMKGMVVKGNEPGLVAYCFSNLPAAA